MIDKILKILFFIFRPRNQGRFAWKRGTIELLATIYFFERTVYRFDLISSAIEYDILRDLSNGLFTQKIAFFFVVVVLCKINSNKMDSSLRVHSFSSLIFNKRICCRKFIKLRFMLVFVATT